MAETINLVPGGAERVIELGHEVAAHRYADGSIRIAHNCRVIDGDQLRIAPALQLGSGHTVVQNDPLTTSPSVLCPDCGLHGFITNGRWNGV